MFLRKFGDPRVLASVNNISVYGEVVIVGGGYV